MTHAVIVDDDQTILYLVQQMVADLGWTSDAFGSGMEALEAMERAPPDVVITDVRMEGMSGIDLIRAMQRNPRLAQIPVVVMSSVDRESEAREAGCADFVAKPFDAGALQGMLERLVGDGPLD